MEKLFSYSQSKKKNRRDNTNSDCLLSINKLGDNTLEFSSEFWTEFHRKYDNKNKKFYKKHILRINQKNGNIETEYELKNYTENSAGLFVLDFGSIRRSRKNNFKELLDLTEQSFYKGQKNIGYWGVKYKKAVDEIFKIIFSELNLRFVSDFFKNKPYSEKYEVNPLFDLVVDFHLDRKKIKPNDMVYYNITDNYPKKKYLLKNENKFIPAILDEFGIKSKYLVGLTNSTYLNLNCLNFIVKLFGENYSDYIRKINLEIYCTSNPPTKKIFELENEFEKSHLVNLFNNWSKTLYFEDSLIYNLNKVFSIREFLKKRNLQEKFNAHNDSSFELLSKKWESSKNHLKKGYREKYSFPEDFINQIEKDIIWNGKCYQVKILSTNEDFITEGNRMKNCMSKKFFSGLIFIYISMSQNKKRINLEYKKGNLTQYYGVANTDVTAEWVQPIEILTERMFSNKNVKWEKIKFDFIKK